MNSCASRRKSCPKWKSTIHFLFAFVFFAFLSHAALETLLPVKLAPVVAIKGGRLTARNWIECRLWLQKIKRCLLPGGKVAGRWIKRGQGEGAAWACFACTGASVGEGADRAPQCCLQLSDNSCSERRDVLRALRHVSLLLHLFPHLPASHDNTSSPSHSHSLHHSHSYTEWIAVESVWFGHFLKFRGIFWSKPPHTHTLSATFVCLCETSVSITVALEDGLMWQLA